MSLSVEQLLHRLEDPETPVVWLDPSASEDLWLGLHQALLHSGFHVFRLDDRPGPSDRADVLSRLAAWAGLDAQIPLELAALNQHLLELPAVSKRGWVIVYRHPEPLRQADEGAFEDLLEMLENVHEQRYGRDGRLFKLLVQD